MSESDSEGHDAFKDKTDMSFREWVQTKGYVFNERGRVCVSTEGCLVPVSKKKYGQLKRKYYYGRKMMYLRKAFYLDCKLSEKDGLLKDADKKFASKWNARVNKMVRGFDHWAKAKT